MASDNPSGDNTNARRSLDFQTPEMQNQTVTQPPAPGIPVTTTPHTPVTTASTPILQTRSPSVGAPHTAVPASEQTNAQTTGVTNPDDTNGIAALQAQLLMLNQRIQTMSAQMATASPQHAPQQQYQSREYWQRPITNTTYPGEDASYSSKRAYQQRLDSYIRKSSFIWRLITKADPCPITKNINAMTLLVSALGTSWKFDGSDISGAMLILQRKTTRFTKRCRNKWTMDTIPGLDRGDNATQHFTQPCATPLTYQTVGATSTYWT